MRGNHFSKLNVWILSLGRKQSHISWRSCAVSQDRVHAPDSLPPASCCKARHGEPGGEPAGPSLPNACWSCRRARGSGTFHGEAKRDPTNCSVTATGDRQRHSRHLSQIPLHRLLLFGHQTPDNGRRSFRLTARETAGVMETGRETKRGTKGRATNIRAVVKCAIEIKFITTECFPVGREI